MSTDERRRRLTRKLREELGEEICDALDDPTVIEIVLNDDGSLFIERLGERMIKVREGFDAEARRSHHRHHRLLRSRPSARARARS